MSTIGLMGDELADLNDRIATLVEEQDREKARYVAMMDTMRSDARLIAAELNELRTRRNVVALCIDEMTPDAPDRLDAFVKVGR